MLTGFKAGVTALILLTCLMQQYQAQVPADAKCNSALDIVFTVDGSASLNMINWFKLKTIIEQTVNNLQISPDRINAGIVIFSSNVAPDGFIPLTGDKNELQTFLQNAKYPNGGTRTDLGIAKATELLKVSRPKNEAPDAIIVVTDGKTDNETLTREKVREAEDAGITIFAVGIAQAVKSSLLLLADEERVIYAGNIDELLLTLETITQDVCNQVTTPPPTVVPTTPGPPPVINTPDICAIAKTREGDNSTGFVYHPTDCDKFIQCHYYERNTVVVYRSCPLGQFWNHAQLHCDEACNVNCPYEKCHRSGVEGYKMEGSCRAFWRCDRFKSLPACCPMGHSYLPGYGCVKDPHCNDFCGHMVVLNGKGICQADKQKSPVVMYRRDPRSPQAINSREWHLKNWFHKQWTTLWSSDVEWCAEDEHKSLCESDRFDLVSCRCANGEASRNAGECRPQLNLPLSSNSTQLSFVPKEAYDLRFVTLTPEFARFPGTFGSLLHLEVDDRQGRPLAFSLRYRENNAVQEKVELIRSTPCNIEGVLYVTLQPDMVTAEISGPSGKFASTIVSTLGFSVTEWKDLTVVYDETSLTLTVRTEDLSYVSRVDAPKVRCFTCGVDVAPGGSFESFTGDMQSAQVSYCYPGTVDVN